MPRTKQTEQLPLEDIPEPNPKWTISEQAKRAGRHWFPIWRKQLNGETIDDNRVGGRQITTH